MCNCSVPGSRGPECDPLQGTCECKPNVKGVKCDQCKDGTINLAVTNPDGCQACFCYDHGQQCKPALEFVQINRNTR